MPHQIDSVFRPESGDWHPVSPRLATARRLVATMWWLLLTLGASVLLVGFGFRSAGLVAVMSGTVLYLWSWWLIGRRVRSFGYQERSEDLLVTSGIMFRRLVIVPYGRMQLVDVRAGPLDRRLGLTTVQLHTAAATSDAAIPGLEPVAAAGLRDRLAAAGETHSAGL